MKRTDMTTGNLYQLTNTNGLPCVVKLLDASTLWTVHTGLDNGFRRTDYTLCRSADWTKNRNDIGYLAIRQWGATMSDNEAATLMQQLDAPATLTEEDVAAFNETLPDTMRLAIINNRKLVAEWDMTDVPAPTTAPEQPEQHTTQDTTTSQEFDADALDRLMDTITGPGEEHTTGVIIKNILAAGGNPYTTDVLDAITALIKAAHGEAPDHGDCGAVDNEDFPCEASALPGTDWCAEHTPRTETGMRD